MTESIADEIKRRVQERHRRLPAMANRNGVRAEVTLDTLRERLPRAATMDELRDGMLAIVDIMEKII